MTLFISIAVYNGIISSISSERCFYLGKIVLAQNFYVGSYRNMSKCHWLKYTRLRSFVRRNLVFPGHWFCSKKRLVLCHHRGKVFVISVLPVKILVNSLWVVYNLNNKLDFKLKCICTIIVYNVYRELFL